MCGYRYFRRHDSVYAPPKLRHKFLIDILLIRMHTEPGWYNLRYGTCLLALWLWTSFSLRESCPSAIALMPDTSVLLFTQLVPLMLLPQCWSSGGVNLIKSLYGFFKRNCLGLQKFLPPTQSPLLFAARSYGNCLSFWHWNPGLGSLE